MILIVLDFWSKFWPVFTASIISGLIFTVLIGLLISTIRKPKIKICLSISTGVKGDYSLRFYAINNGKVGLMPNEMQWNVYFPLALQPKESFKGNLVKIILNSLPYYNSGGFNDRPILPGDSLLLVYIHVDKYKKLAELLDDFEWIDEAKYYYSFSTTRGQKKYQKFFWEFFKKPTYIEGDTFVKRPIFEITEKIL
jgi:hypothetical protein